MCIETKKGLYDAVCKDVVSHGGSPAMLAMTIITAMSALKGSAQTSLIAAPSATCTSLQHTLEQLKGIAESKLISSGLHACEPTTGARVPDAAQR